MAGIGDFLDDPLTQMGAGLLGGQSPFFGVNVAGAYQQMLAQRQEALKRQMLQQQLESGSLDLAQKKQNQADEEQLRHVMQSGGYAPQSADAMAPTQQTGQPQTLPGGRAMSVGAPPDSAKATLFDQFSQKAAQLERLGSPLALQQAKGYRDLAEKYRPELKETKILMDASGQRITVNLFKDGTQQVVPFAPEPKELHFADTGRSIQGLDPLTGKPVGQAQAKTITPGEDLSARVNMRGQNMTDTRDRISIAYNTGYGANQFGFQPPKIPGVDTSGMAPVTAAGIASDVGKKQAETVQQAATQLPAVEAVTKQTIDLVDKMLAHPGFSTTVGAKGLTGAFAAAGHPIPGTDAADFVTLQKQVTGKQFLQAYETLKGAGAITEVEGKKATAAIAAMDNAQSEKAYTAAARDFQDTLRGTLSRLRSRASGNTSGWSIKALD